MSQEPNLPPNRQKDQVTHTGKYIKYEKDKTLGKRDYKTFANIRIREIDPASSGRQLLNEFARILNMEADKITTK